MGYFYQVDTYCDECGELIKAGIAANDPAKVPEDWMDLHSYDSDDYPKPADWEHEESDTPAYCSKCGEFGHNPLTSAGYRYVKAALDEVPALTSTAKLREANHPHLADWAAWYGFEWWDAEDCADYSGKYQVGWNSREAF